MCELAVSDFEGVELRATSWRSCSVPCSCAGEDVQQYCFVGMGGSPLVNTADVSLPSVSRLKRKVFCGEE